MNDAPWWTYWLLIIGMCLSMLGIYALILRKQHHRPNSEASVHCFACGATIKAQGDSSIILQLCQVMEDHRLHCVNQGGGMLTFSGPMPTHTAHDEGAGPPKPGGVG